MATFTARMIALLAIASSRNNFAALRDAYFGERYPSCSFGLSAEFFFDCRGETEHVQSVIDLAKDYYNNASVKPNLIVGDERVQKIETVDQLVDFAQTERKTAADQRIRAFGFYFVRRIEGTRLSWYQFSCTIDGREYPLGGYIYTSWPLISDDLELERYVERFLAFARASRATYAVSGMALLYETYASVAPEVCFPFYKRFPGFVYADAAGFALVRERDRRAIRDVNWLTAIGGEGIAQLGGLADVRESLTDEIAVTPYDGGVLFRAGLQPVLGDTNLGKVPKPYRQVNALLRPLRLKSYGPVGYLRVPSPFDAGKETREWLARFD